MKHKPVLIKGEDLRTKLFFDGDYAEVELANDDLKLVTLDALTNWWIVTWPEHVTSPSYNGDATYGQIRPQDYDAYVKDGAIVYGEVN